MTVFKEKLDGIQMLQLQENLQTSEWEYQILGCQEYPHFTTKACEKSQLVETGGCLYDLTLLFCFTVAMSVCNSVQHGAHSHPVLEGFAVHWSDNSGQCVRHKNDQV